ncbi:MAG: adenylyltransferase/cytidyltransferase family protein, partial [Leptolyngbyaceae cyanobacterium]
MTHHLFPQTVFVSGNFNVLHPGHLRLLRFARECGDRLVVAVHSDRIAAKAAHVPEQYRLEMLKANSWVDEAFLIDEPITDVLQRLQPAIVVKGKEHESRFNPELAVLEAYGGRLLFGSGEATFSSLDLIRNEFTQTNLHAIGLPDQFMARHGLTQAEMMRRVEGFSNLRVCVVGDLIIDEYITCQP